MAVKSARTKKMKSFFDTVNNNTMCVYYHNDDFYQLDVLKLLYQANDGYGNVMLYFKNRICSGYVERI